MNNGTEPSAPHELVFAPLDSARYAVAARRAVGVAILGAVPSFALALLRLPWLAGAFYVAAIAAGSVAWYRASRPTGLLLRIDGEVLELARRDGGGAPRRVWLRDLRDVKLETRTIRRVEMGRGPVAQLRWIDMSVGPEIDIGHVVLRVKGMAPIRLSDDWLAHTDCMEWLSRIRRFLRQNGWLPRDERKRLAAEARP